MIVSASDFPPDRRVLFCSRATPDLHRRPLLSPREVFCGPDCADAADEGGVVSLRTPTGEYDLAAVVARLPAEQRPDLVVVKADATRGNFPRNLDRLPCPKVLLVGDTHHLPAPLRFLLRYAGMETFDAIILDHTRQHAHVFQDAGFERVYWIPAFDYALRQRPIPDAPAHPLTFIGQTGAFHPYRRQVLQTVQDAGLPLEVWRTAPEETADLQAASGITVNCSLNGDLNLRVFEALGAGAFLLTDRLAPEAGLDRLFTAGHHLDSYGTPGELVEKIRHYLDHPDEARRIRKAGQQHLLANHAPAVKRRQLFDLLDHGRVDPALDLAGERRGPAVAGRAALERRVTAYEAVQQMHLRAERLTLLLDPGDALALAATARDLPRVRVFGHDHVTAGLSLPPVHRNGLSDQEVLALPWPETAEAAPALLAGFQGDHVLAVGRSWRDGRAAAAFLAGWGFTPADEAGLYRCTDPFALTEAAMAYATAHKPDPAAPGAHAQWARIARLSGLARDAGQAWRAARLAEGTGDPLLHERLLRRCVSLDRGHPEALRALGVAAPGLPRAAAMATEKRRSLLVVTNLFPPQEFGGYGRKLWEFTAELRRRGHRVRVLTADVPEFARPGVAGSEDLEPVVDRSLRLCGSWVNGVAAMDADPQRRAALMAANDRRILDMAAAVGADVCLAGNVDLMATGFLSALPERGIPVIHCVGNRHPGYDADQAPRSPLYRLGPASAWVAAQLDRDGFAGVGKTILYPGARVDRFHRAAAPAFDRLRIAFASLLVPYKGPQVLANALAFLHHNGIDFDCTFAGEAPDPGFAGHLRNFCARFGPKVRFSGFLDRNGMAALFDRCNVLVFPSTFEEPFGITQVEAMAAGLAVVSSGSGGSGEIVRDGLDGLIAPPGNAEALAVALAGLPADPARWARLARNGQARAFAFTVSATVDRIEETMDALLEKAAPRAVLADA